VSCVPSQSHHPWFGYPEKSKCEDALLLHVNHYAKKKCTLSRLIPVHDTELLAGKLRLQKKQLAGTQNICEPQLRHSKRGREDGKGKKGSKTPYALPIPLPSRTSTGWPATCVFVTVNEARRYLATSIRLAVSNKSEPYR
jgi:hypothetical protein